MVAVAVVAATAASFGGATVELPPQFDWRHRPALTAVATLRSACVRWFVHSYRSRRDTGLKGDNKGRDLVCGKREKNSRAVRQVRGQSPGFTGATRIRWRSRRGGCAANSPTRKTRGSSGIVKRSPILSCLDSRLESTQRKGNVFPKGNATLFLLLIQPFRSRPVARSLDKLRVRSHAS